MKLDDAILEQVVRSHVGSQAEIWRHDRSINNPMNVVLRAAEEVIKRPIAVFWVEGGLPESFSLPSLTPAVIIFSVRYLEMVSQLRGISTNTTLDEKLLAEVSERISLRILSELILRYGNPALACYLFMKSLIEEGVYFTPPSLDVIETVAKNEMYMAVWFYALLHELGHVHAEHVDGEVAPPQDYSYLDEKIDSVLNESFSEEIVEKAHRSLRQGDTKLSLGRDVLVPELSADLFSAQLLYTATIRVMRIEENLGQFDAGRLALELLTMFRLSHYMNSCSLAARYATDIGSRPLLDPWGNAANAVRLNVTIDFLAHYLVTGGAVSSAPDQAKFSELRGRLIESVHQSPARASSFDRGHTRAIEECFFLNQRDDNLAGRLAEYIQSTLDTALFRIEADRFCKLAQSLGVTSPDIDLLAAFAKDPARAVSTLRQGQLVFKVAWIRGDGVSMPFGLRTRGIYVVFVFLGDSAFDYFLEESRTMIRPGFELQRTAVISPTEHNVALVIHRALPKETEKYVEVVFEGSAGFDRRFQELNDGTFWEDG